LLAVRRLCWVERMSILDDPGLFGRQWAAMYDDPGNPDPVPAVEFLAGLAAGGPVLELAIGSGRVALPLAGRGVPVEGIEASPEMAALLRAKPGGDAIVAISAFTQANDDHTLLMAPTSTFTAHPYQHEKLAYDVKELVPIARVSNTSSSASPRKTRYGLRSQFSRIACFAISTRAPNFCA